MCTLRALYVLSQSGDVVFSRYVCNCTWCSNKPSRFPTVEKRAKTIYKDDYVSIPKENEFKKLVFDELTRVSLDQDLAAPLPILSLKGHLWPILCLKKVI